MNERRKTPPQPPTDQELARSKYTSLRNREWELNAIIAKSKPVVDGQIDYSEYDAAMQDLRAVRVEMASLLWSQQ